MREIKFRAWDKQQKKMAKVYTFGFKECDHCEHKNPMELAVVHYVDGGGVYLREGEYEVMQYTGLKDKNGVEIYEGDIVMLEESTSKIVIRWNNNCGGWEPWVCHIEDFDNIDDCPCTVIGNIYENSELLA